MWPLRVTSMGGSWMLRGWTEKQPLLYTASPLCWCLTIIHRSSALTVCSVLSLLCRGHKVKLILAAISPRRQTAYMYDSLYSSRSRLFLYVVEIGLICVHGENGLEPNCLRAAFSVCVCSVRLWITFYLYVCMCVSRSCLFRALCL